MKKMKPTNCDDIAGLIPAYALEAIPPTEQVLVEAHVAACPECRALLTEHQALADGLLYTAPAVTAPPHLEADLRRRLAGDTAQAAQSPLSPSRGWFARLFSPAARPALALSVLLVLTLAASNTYWLWTSTEIRTEQAVLTEKLEHAELDEEMLYDAMRFLATGGRAIVLKGAALAPQGVGTLTVAPDRPEAFLVVDDMPPLAQGKIYQLWLIHAGGRESGGVFDLEEEGDKVFIVRPERPIEQYQALEVTLEPVGGSRQPTGPQVMRGRI